MYFVAQAKSSGTGCVGGRLGHILIHLLPLVLSLEQNRGQCQDRRLDLGVVVQHDLPGRSLALIAIGPGKVEVVLIDRAFSEEILQVFVMLQVKQLILDQPVQGLHVAFAFGHRGGVKT